ncbi:MAG: Eco57I restriction-modification methylase domain-containing protein, partial [Candidatus Hodarchaeota archaeon]
MKFKEIKSFNGLKIFFEERNFKQIIDPEIKKEALKAYPHYYFELNDEGEAFSVFVVDNQATIQHFKSELIKDRKTLYQFIFYEDFKKFVFIMEDFGLSKLRIIRKRYSDLNQIFLNKFEALEYDDFDSFNALFDRSEIIKEFYDYYVICENFIHKNIKGVPNEEDKGKITQILLNRIMFLWFLQIKRFLNNDERYLISKFIENFEGNFYSDFLTIFFFKGLCIEPKDREKNLIKLIGEIPYLNGGLFLPTEEELKYKNSIQLSNKIFYKPMHYPLSPDITELPIFNLMESKKWATDEKTGEIDEINPEILGFIFEKSINKKALGAVYTPEEITSRMCKGVLLEYVNEEVSKKNKEIENFKEYGHILHLDDEKVKKKIIRKLNSIKILDPACGSGHFLLEMLFYLEKIYLSLNPRLNRFKLRENIILNNIYGVDILPEAVEIAKLRLFLALAETYKNIEEIQPLPNIDFHLRSGNSVLGFFEKKEGNLNDFLTGSIASLIDDRNNLIKIYEKTNSLVALEKRKILLEKTEELQEVFTKKLITKIGKDQNSSKFNKTFNPFHWSMEFSELFESQNSGFDIVIGNPPYIKADSEDKYYQSYRKLIEPLYEFLYEKWDLYAAFIELGLKILKPNGILSYIISDSFKSAKFGKKLRKELVKKNFYQILFFPEIKVFEGIGVNNIIISIKNSKSTESFSIERIIFESLTKTKTTERIKLHEQDELVFRLTSSDVLFAKVQENTIQLNDICYISKGMVLNSDEKKYQGLFQKDDIVFETRLDDNMVPYTENKYVSKYLIERTLWLEYGTDRVPGKISRKTFPELYLNNKIFIGKMGARAVLDEKNHFSNDSLMIVIPYHSISNAKARVLNRKKNKELISTGKNISLKFDL